MSDGLFEIAPVRIHDGDHVEVTMLWDEVWRCGVVKVRQRDGWPVADLHRLLLGPYGPDDVFTVDLARCRLVQGAQPALDGL